MGRSESLHRVDTLQALSEARNDVVERVRRVRYVSSGAITSDHGPVELSWVSGRILLFDAGADGMTLEVKDKAWSDPFAAPLTDENEAYVQRFGKWTAFDVTSSPPFDRLVGNALHSFRLEFDSGVVVGADLDLGVVLKIRVGVDDLRVDISI